MKKMTWLAFAVGVGAVTLSGTTVHAAQADLNVTPVQAASQRDKSESFFNLVLQPNQSENLSVKLQNTTKKDMVVDAQAAPASTSNSGIVQYDNQAKLDPSLVYNVNKLVQAPDKITIPAGQTVTYTAKLTMPGATLPGMVSGALIFEPETGEKATTGQGSMGIVNKFQYTVGILARNENRTWEPDLTFAGVATKNEAGTTNIAIKMRNTTSTYLNQLAVEATVTKDGKTYARKQRDMQMAPNSNFSYLVPLKENATAGKYTMKTTAYYVKDSAGQYQDGTGQRYRYKKTYTNDVTLTSQQAKKLNADIKQAAGGVPTSIIAGISAIVVLVAAVFGMIFLMMKRRKRADSRMADLEAELAKLKANQK
ncbi:DUF916 and DUF3324 domain-containing protein [Weissella cibaria]|uniref:DUF916 and DUF3324 domain-containing protein n=1 Tax=Weissella cibaria TaxID=137591 RepID=UPI00376F00D9